ncbi:MAG: DUF2723 domain-containing protein, partial [Myxococcales bacterium]
MSSGTSARVLSALSPGKLAIRPRMKCLPASARSNIIADPHALDRAVPYIFPHGHLSTSRPPSPHNVRTVTGKNPPDHSSGHSDALAGALLGVALFGVYALGAARTIYVGDSGELVAAVHTLGIPHPSGYPLYVLLGKLFTLIVPVGSIAFRMSLFSAAAAAAACGGLFVLARRLGLGREAALLASLLLAFAPSFWSQANVQRAYALNALFVVAATGSAVHWLRVRTERSIALAFFLCGLGSSNHTFMAIYAVALGVYMLGVDRAVIAAPAAFMRRGVVIGGSFLVGLLPYAYLPLRSRMNPRLDWGNPETLQGFSDVVLREDFWERAW